MHFQIEHSLSPIHSLQWEWVEDIYNTREIAERRFAEVRAEAVGMNRLRLVEVIEETY